jgi:hypothetical protein
LKKGNEFYLILTEKSLKKRHSAVINYLLVLVPNLEELYFLRIGSEGEISTSKIIEQ